MNLNEYLSTDGAQARLAKALGKSTAQVWQWKEGMRPVPVDLCAQVERFTDGMVTRQELRPDDWQLIWPELCVPTEPTAPGIAAEPPAAEQGA